MNHDFAPTPRTLFEAFASHSLSIQSYANRGVHESKKLGWQFAMAKYQEEYAALHFVAQTPWLGPAFIPDWFGAESQVTDAAIHDLQHTPKIQWITYASPDGRHHVHGFEPTYNALLRHIDSEIGRYRQASQVLGQEAQRIYAIVSDHGVVNVEHNLDLREPLSQLGLRTWRGEATELATDSLADPTSTWNDVDAIVAVNGNTMNWVYLREGGQGWEAKPRAEAFSAAIAELLATDGVEFVASRTREGVAVASSDGTALLKKIDDGYVYDCSAGDPFGYGTTVPNGCDGKARTANEWLSSTFATDFPYAVPRMYDVMQTPHAGELLVTAKAGYDLAAHYELVVKEGNYKGGHGGLRADQLRVPYIVAGGGVRPQTVDTLLAEDVGVLLERLLGLQSQGQHPRVDALAALP